MTSDAEKIEKVRQDVRKQFRAKAMAHAKKSAKKKLPPSLEERHDAAKKRGSGDDPTASDDEIKAKTKKRAAGRGFAKR
jgi:hypothetical protein